MSAAAGSSSIARLYAAMAPASSSGSSRWCPMRNCAYASATLFCDAEAYAQFLIGHHLDETDDEAGAIAAYRRAMELDPAAADIPAELAALYLRQKNKI